MFISSYLLISSQSNDAGGIRGGGIRIGSNANVTVERSVFTNNTAHEGGAIYITPKGFLTITNSDFQNNQAEVRAITLILISLLPIFMFRTMLITSIFLFFSYTTWLKLINRE
jgi:hypothetical protein